MNTKEQNSVRALIQWVKDGENWGNWRGSIRLVDPFTVNTTFGDFTVQVDGDKTWLVSDKNEVTHHRKAYIPTKDYCRLMQKNIKKLVDL